MKDTRIALVLQNAVPGDFDRNMASLERFVLKAAAQQADIIVFPELNLTGYTSGAMIQDLAISLGPELKQRLLELAASSKMIVLSGLARRDNNNRILACHTVAHPDGRFEWYDKVHTAPPEKAIYIQGPAPDIFISPTLTFGVQLCYDAHFPSLSTDMAIKGADLIVIPHASPRGTSQEKKSSWLRHLTARAFDNGIFIAACNQVGDNGCGLVFPGVALVIGPDGRIQDELLNDNSEAMLVSTLRKKDLDSVRTHQMRYFLPNRRSDLYGC